MGGLSLSSPSSFLLLLPPVDFFLLFFDEVFFVPSLVELPLAPYVDDGVGAREGVVCAEEGAGES